MGGVDLERALPSTPVGDWVTPGVLIQLAAFGASTPSVPAVGRKIPSPFLHGWKSCE